MRARLLVVISCLGFSAAAQASARSGDFSIELLGENGRVLPTFQEGGKTYAMGAMGHRYSLRLRNRSGERVELVAAVDGRDVVDGRASRLEKRGYILDPHSEVVIDGFRVSTESVAAFRFSSVHSSYAARMGGDVQDVGLIAVAVFRENIAPPIVESQPPPFWKSLWNDDGSQSEHSSADEAPPAPAPAVMSMPAAVASPPAAAAVDKLVASQQSMQVYKGMGSLGAGGTMSGVGFAALRGSPAAAEGARKESRGVYHGAGLVQAPAKASRLASAEVPVEKSDLGTEFGEHRESHVDVVGFERRSVRPDVFLSLRYDDYDGLESLGIDVDGRLEASRERRRQSAHPFRRNTATFERSPGLVAK